MSLQPSALENRLKAIFNDASGDDRKFSDDFAAAVKDYAGSGDIATTDTGTISAGAFTGTGKGSITVTTSDCADLLYEAARAMAGTGGNDILAAKMAEGVDAMIAGGVIKTNVTGVCTPPSGSPFTLSDSAEGSATGSPSPMEAAFFSAFETMNSMSTGNNDYMAAQCTAAIDAYLKACTVDTKGKNTLSGSRGTGKMS